MSHKLMPRRDSISKELKPCPFCGGKASMTVGITGITAIVCTNYTSCGAYVTFDNPVANRNMDYAPLYWNARKDS